MDRCNYPDGAIDAVARFGEGDVDALLDDHLGVSLHRYVGVEIGDNEGAAVRGGRLLQIAMPLDEFARELADVIIDGVLSIPASSEG